MNECDAFDNRALYGSIYNKRLHPARLRPTRDDERHGNPYSPQFEPHQFYYQLVDHHIISLSSFGS